MNRLIEALWDFVHHLLEMSLSDWGSWASLVGLGITGWIAWRLRGIQKRHVSRVRLPELIEHFEKKLGLLNRLITTPTRPEREVADALNAIIVDLDFIMGKTTRANARLAKRLKQRINGRPANPPTQWLVGTFDDGVSLLRYVRESTRDARVEVIT